MSKDLNDVFNEFLLSMLDSSNATLISELRLKWKQYMNTPIIEINKPVEVLFIAADGKDVLIGSKFYSVTDSFEIVVSDAVRGMHINNRIKLRSFSTEKSANEWIAWNKPHISLSEIMSKSIWHCGHKETERRSFSRKELTDFAMSKVGRHDG